MKIKFLNGTSGGVERDYPFRMISIGRDENNEICLDSAGVSRHHARLFQDKADNWFVCDCNSTNGVKINGSRIFNDTRIQEGDVIDIGQQQLMILSFRDQTGPVVFNPVITAPLPEGQTALPQAASYEKTIQIPAEKEEKKQDPDGKNPLENLKTLGPLFSRSGKDGGETAKEKGNAGQEKGKKHISSLTFYVVLVCAVVIVLSVVLRKSEKQYAAPPVRNQPLALTYEKTVIDKGNVFRFEFKLFRKWLSAAEKANRKTPSKSPWRYMGAFTLDDLGSQRHYTAETELAGDTVEQLRNAIQSSGILALPDSVLPPDRVMNRKMQIIFGTRIMKFSVPGEFAGNEFNRVEDAITRIAEYYGLETIVLTPEQLLQQAKQNFLKAEDRYDNRATPGNLRDAIRFYRAVVNSLEQVSPKPAIWALAGKRLNAAEEERREKLKNLNLEYSRLKQIQNFEGMRGVFLRIMELTEPDSREYDTAKKRMIIIEQVLRKKRK